MNHDDIYDEEGEIGGRELLDALGIPEKHRREAVKRAATAARWPTRATTANGEVYTFESGWKMCVTDGETSADASICVIRPNGKTVTLTDGGAKTVFHTFDLEGALRVYLKGTDAPTRNGLQQVVENSWSEDPLPPQEDVFDPDDRASDVILNVAAFDAERAQQNTESTYVGPAPRAPQNPPPPAPAKEEPDSRWAKVADTLVDVAAVGVIVGAGVALVKVVPPVLKAVAKGLR